MSVRASVLIPTHDQPTTLPLTVDTVLHQSVDDLEVLLIGDGVTQPARTVIEGLVRGDERVRFLDFAKGPHHGERYRHDAVMAARSDAIFYLCDDDLLLPDHVADLLGLLEHHTFVQSLNGYVMATGEVRLYAADLADPATVAAHLRDDLRFCSVSITGTAHSKAFYREVGDRWDTTPPGWWPDHWQWRKLMRHPSYRGATSARMTALQFPTSSEGRHAWSAAARRAEVLPWHALVRSPRTQELVDERVRAGMVAQLVEQRVGMALLVHDRELIVQDRRRIMLELEEALRAVEEARESSVIAQRLHAEQLASAVDAHLRLGEALDTAEALRAQLTRTRRRVARLRARLRGDVVASGGSGAEPAAAYVGPDHATHCDGPPDREGGQRRA